MSLKIAIVDDHPIVAEAMSDMVRSCADFAVHSVSSSLEQFYCAQQASEADMLLLDVALGDTNSLGHLIEILDTFRDLRVIVFSMFDSAPYVQSAYRNGASGFVSKGRLHSDLLLAIQTVAAGDAFFPVDVPLASTAEGVARLSQREREVLRLAVGDHTTKFIAATLDCSPKTIYAHLANITEKLGTRDRSIWRQWALAEGLISPLDRG